MNQKRLRLGHIMDNSKLISLIVLLLILLMFSLLPMLSSTSILRTKRVFHSQSSQHVVQNVDFSPLQDNKDYWAEELLSTKHCGASASHFLYPQHLALSLIPAECEWRDVIYSLPFPSMLSAIGQKINLVWAFRQIWQFDKTTNIQILPLN